MICLKCVSTTRPDASVCEHCGAPLVVGCRFAISTALGERVVVVPLPPSMEIIVGREDPVQGVYPDLDTTGLSASAAEVSRRHVLLRRRQSGQWCVVPFKTTNPTYVNGTRLEPDQSAPIEARGDTLLLGGLTMFVFCN
jgi:hypothetical protein